MPQLAILSYSGVNIRFCVVRIEGGGTPGHLIMGGCLEKKLTEGEPFPFMNKIKT